jgi:hypothetical protein
MPQRHGSDGCPVLLSSQGSRANSGVSSTPAGQRNESRSREARGECDQTVRLLLSLAQYNSGDSLHVQGSRANSGVSSIQRSTKE